MSGTTPRLFATRVTKLNANITPTASRYSRRDQAADAAAATSSGVTVWGRVVTATARATNARKSGAVPPPRGRVREHGSVGRTSCRLQEPDVRLRSVLARVRAGDRHADRLLRLQPEVTAPHEVQERPLERLQKVGAEAERPH